VKTILRIAAAILIGITLSVVAHFVVFECLSTEYFQSYHAEHRWLKAVFFAPGRMFAGSDSGTRFLFCNVLAVGLLFGVGASLWLRRRSQLTLRLAGAILIGVLLSAALHFLALEYIWTFHAYNGWLDAVFFALGKLLAPSGFEEQAALGLPLNFFALATIFAAGAFLLLRERARRHKA